MSDLLELNMRMVENLQKELEKTRLELAQAKKILKETELAIRYYMTKEASDIDVKDVKIVE